MDVHGKVAIVTGASSGIGAATVKTLHDIGMKVVGFARRKERIEQLIENHEGRLFAVKVDVTKRQEILDGFAWVTQNVGPIDVLINNAGVALVTDVINGNEDTWQQIIDTNFTSNLLCCREAIRNMQEHGISGYIINVSSVAGLRPLPFPLSTVYSATKAALCGLTESLRMELIRANSKIRTTCLNPGLVQTELLEASGAPKEVLAELVYSRPFLFSEDIANTIKFLVQTPQHVQVSSLLIQPTGEQL